MSIFKEDLAKLEELLAGQGFRIFINFEADGRGLLKAATAEEIAALDKPDLSICKVGPGGKIQKETTEPFNFVDLHVHDKDGAGNTVINYSGATLPKEFFEPVKKELANGKEINLSQPVVVAYHKLHADRPYDLTDLQRLRPYLQEGDFAMLREVLGWETEESEKKAREKLREAWDSLSLASELAHDPDVISEKLWTHPDLRARRDDPKVSEYVSLISHYLSENPKVSREDFLDRSLAILKVREQIEQKIKVIDQLEKSKT
jgi:hypothetical protein